MNEDLAVLEFQIERGLESRVYSDAYMVELIRQKLEMLYEEDTIKKSE